MSQLILGILGNFLGVDRGHNHDSGQIKFDCPSCAEINGSEKSVGKGNLEVNINKGVFKCWACYETNNMSGSISRLIKRFGSRRDFDEYVLINPNYNYDKEYVIDELKELSLPDGFTPLASCDEKLFRFSEASKYLSNRNITHDIIEKYNIGFTTIGEYANRIIIPSYCADGNLNFFVGRAFTKWGKPKYLNPTFRKELITFSENFINWDATIYLVEGVFDGIVIPNSIPLLGKVLPIELLYKLQTKAKGLIVVALDGDAYEDAKIIYKRINTLNLYNRVRMIKLKEAYDLSLINEKFGRKAIIAVLKTANIIPESEL